MINEKLKIKNEIKGKHEKLNEKPNFEQKSHSRKAEALNKFGYDNYKLMKWIVYCDQKFEKIIYYELIASILKYVFELSQW